MRKIARTLGALALLATIGAPILFFFDALAEDTMKAVLLMAAILWFIVAPVCFSKGREFQPDGELPVTETPDRPKSRT